MWGLWTKRHWGRFSPSTSVSPASHHFTNFSIIIITRGLLAYWWPQCRVDPIGLHPPLYQLKNPLADSSTLRWRRYVPPNRRLTQDLHSATSQKTPFFTSKVWRSTSDQDRVPLFRHHVQTGNGAHPGSYSSLPRAVSLGEGGIQWLERQADQSLPFSAKDKNECSYPSTTRKS
jgi:hypothetical protein